MTSTSKSGIRTDADGAAFIPASQRPDGSTRKEIRVRPGYRPPEDVETYKNRSAEAWKTRGKGGIPGIEVEPAATEVEAKSKNAKRREAARRKVISEANTENHLSSPKGDATQDRESDVTADHQRAEGMVASQDPETGIDAERLKKIRNTLKKLKAVRELKDKRSSGEKLSHDQLLKIGKEDELLRDLKKLEYVGPELQTSEDC